MPVYWSGVPLLARVVYSTRHKCNVPKLDPDAMLCPASAAVHDVMRPAYHIVASS